MQTTLKFFVDALHFELRVLVLQSLFDHQMVFPLIRGLLSENGLINSVDLVACFDGAAVAASTGSEHEAAPTNELLGLGSN